MPPAPRIHRAFMPALVLACAAAPAAGDVRALELVKPDAPAITLTAGSMDRLDLRLRSFLDKAGVPSPPPVMSILSAMGLGAGVDARRSAAIVLDRSRPDAPPRVVIVLPVSGIEAFLDAVGGVPTGDDFQFDYAGVAYTLRRAGRGHVAIASDRAALGVILESPRRLDSLTPMARACLLEADVAARFRPADLDALIDAAAPLVLRRTPEADRTRAVERVRRLLTRQENPVLSATFLGRVGWVAYSEASECVLGATFEPAGVRVDLVLTFPPEALCRHACVEGPGHADPLAVLPDHPFLAAVGVDAGHPGVRLLVSDLAPPGRATGWLADLERPILRAAQSMDAAAAALYETPSFLLGAASRAVIAWRSPTPEEGVSAFGEWVQGLNNQPLGTGTITTVWTPAGEPGGSAYRWTITPPGGSLPAMPMVFGPFPDIQGRAASHGDRGCLISSRDTALFDLWLTLGQPGGVGTLASSPRVRDAAARLPARRVAEAYFDSTTIIRQASRLIPDFEEGDDEPAPLPLVAAAVSAQGGSARLTVFVPAPVVRAAAALTRGARAAAPVGEDR